MPISSAGHLIISRELLGLVKQALIIDVAAHGGTLCAALVYFRGEALACLRGLAPQSSPEDRHLLKLAFVASVPVLVFGAALFLSAAIEPLRVIAVVALANLVFACLLFVGDRCRQDKTSFTDMTLPQAFAIGLAQSLALIPGASRAGTVITAARFFGYSRHAAARFALFLALPAIGGAVLLSASALISPAFISSGGFALEDFAFILGIALLSFLVALAVLVGFIRFSQKFSLVGFVVYRLALSALLIMMIVSDYI